MNIKAIALDMDGTLLNKSGMVEENVIIKLNSLREQGVKLFVATGRTKKEIADVLPAHLDLDGYVTANGMGVYTKDKQLARFSLEENLLQKVIANARKDRIYYEVHPEEENRFALEEDKAYFASELKKEFPKTLLVNEWNSRKEALNKNIYWVNQLSYANIVKVYFFSMDINKIDRWKNALIELKKDQNFSMSSSSRHNVEMMVAGISKGTGMQLLLDAYNMSKHNLLAVGDGENDLAMFELAGHAVAMKNANSRVQAQADEVTDYTYEENGLLHYLNKLYEILN
ncbi:HAD family phosphatase [Ornithinibacillus massiliensis]|uniref:HAD family phosphatase n=1 Tax=Ornithinibacillus massiliensis TaxID=1944633 RepID=A0ABS5MH06_9BACI|nr:HAD family phosphatase [Ornithinibacillus massiliensis]